VSVPVSGVPDVSGVAPARSSSVNWYAPVVSPTPLTVSVYAPAGRLSSPGPSTESEVVKGRSVTCVPAGPARVQRIDELYVRLSK
jgi:hypothetical protein